MDSGMWVRVLNYVDSHIHEKISLCDLAEIAGYSPFYFSRLFAEAMGMPVTGYIRIRKLQHAIVSLLEGKKVLEVALLYAFDSHEGFTRSFTQLFGSTPSMLRKSLNTYKMCIRDRVYCFMRKSSSFRRCFRQLTGVLCALRTGRS